MKAAACSSCKALVIWSITKNGKAMPVDAKAVPNGNIELEPASDPREPPTAHYLDKQGRRAIPCEHCRGTGAAAHSRDFTGPGPGSGALVRLDCRQCGGIGSTRRAPMLRYVSHFATCPNAAEHRKP